MSMLAVVAPPCPLSGNCRAPLSIELPGRNGLTGRTDEQVDATVAMMREIVKDAQRFPSVIDLARRSSHGLSASASFNIYDLLRSRMKFEPDPKGQEALKHPATLATIIAAGGVARGDCDDRAMLGASLLLAIGRPPVLIVMRGPSGDYEHVYYGAARPDQPGGAVPFDPQEGTPAGSWTAGTGKGAYTRYPKPGTVKVFDVASDRAWTL